VAFAFYILLTRRLPQRMHPVATRFNTVPIASLAFIPVLIFSDGSGSDLFDPIWPSDIA
jgi:drug/metabolite transporter (DMT)-like permease